MNEPTSRMDQPNEQNGRVLWLLCAYGFLVSPPAVSGQSLWIDEALTAWKAKQPTLNTWWQAMADEKTSDPQRRALSDKKRPPPRAIWID